MSKKNYLQVCMIVVGILIGYCLYKGTYYYLSLVSIKESYTFFFPELTAEAVEKDPIAEEQMNIKSAIIFNNRLYIDYKEIMETKQKVAYICQISNLDSMDYSKIDTWYLPDCRAFDLGLLKWLVTMLVLLWAIGLFLFTKKYVGMIIKSPVAMITIVSAVGLLFYKVLTYYKVSFPLWCLPTQWSDFEKYLELFKSVQKQFLSIVYYRELPIIVEYYEGIFYCIYLMGMTLILLYTEKVIWKKYRQFFEIN